MTQLEEMELLDSDGRIQLNSPSVQSQAKSLLLSLDESLSLSIVILTFLYFRPHDT